ncbi:TniQ protein [Edaphobacter modestus]|uniref:TniQ protein n=1 Tax=Edaphobacter modestus TaxID=388466 RepID=A0A4Q7YT74_9BACT|nr:TniQ protein [Edaphobacter modestus]
MTHGSTPDLHAISYQTAGRYSSRVRLLGQEVNPKHLLFTTAKVCPECVAEKKFIEAHWDLKLMVGCPVHRRLAARVTSRTAVYGPVCALVWQGSAGNCRPYADQTRFKSTKGTETQVIAGHATQLSSDLSSV